MSSNLTYVFLGTGIAFLGTSIGAASVFFFRKGVSKKSERIFLGFAAGIMIAASVFSLLIPAMEFSEAQGGSKWIPAAGGFFLGCLFLFFLDQLIPHLHPGTKKTEGLKSSFRRTTMLVFAVTLHNIPEGMAVGLAFSLAGTGNEVFSLAAAFALAIGIGLQNLPEGAAISLPLKGEGCSNLKAFAYGSLSGIVEPIFGVLAVLVAGSVVSLMPWFLSFAAGAMIYVVVEELIPEAHLGEHSHFGTWSVLIGFLIMMILDIALG